jgi:hypothetical protein
MKYAIAFLAAALFVSAQPAPSPRRDTAPCTVPYRKASDGGMARPQLPVRLSYGPQTINAVALVDSGADDTVFPLSYAGRLGIDLSGLPATETAGVGSEHNLTYRATVVVRKNNSALRISTIRVMGRDVRFDVTGRRISDVTSAESRRNNVTHLLATR